MVSADFTCLFVCFGFGRMLVFLDFFSRFFFFFFSIFDFRFLVDFRSMWTFCRFWPISTDFELLMFVFVSRFFG